MLAAVANVDSTKRSIRIIEQLQRQRDRRQTDRWTTHLVGVRYRKKKTGRGGGTSGVKRVTNFEPVAEDNGESEREISDISGSGRDIQKEIERR